MTILDKARDKEWQATPHGPAGWDGCRWVSWRQMMAGLRYRIKTSRQVPCMDAIDETVKQTHIGWQKERTTDMRKEKL
jgi:hypothetical protein